MTLKTVYNRLVADTFDADPFDLYKACRAIALAQIGKNLGPDLARAVDLGSGTGDLLIALARLFPSAELLGIDSSIQMIDIAKRKFLDEGLSGITLIQDDVARLISHFSPRSLDLMTAHFLLSSSDSGTLLTEAFQLLKDKGFLSVATGTRQNFLTLKGLASQFLPDFVFEDSLNVPLDTHELLEMIDGFGFTVVEKNLFSRTIRLNDFDELYRFVFHSGWFVHPILTEIKEPEIELIREVSKGIFPIEDVAQFSIILAQKP